MRPSALPLRGLIGGLLFIALSSVAFAAGVQVKTFDADKKLQGDCVGCHINVTPGIVKQHLGSPHANASNPEDEVLCSSCHGDKHVTMEDWQEATMPTADTCGECHKKQAREHSKGKHQLGWMVMKSQIAWHGQPGAITEQGYRGCSGCHKIGKKGLLGVTDGNTDAKVAYDGGKEEAHYRYGNAQCDACHTRHSFKKSEAKDPRACSNCHMGFDHPQWEMYTSAKHGVIWGIEGHEEDGRAPTCQTCHLMEGNHEVRTPWGFLGLRIPTKENVLALIKVAPSLEPQLTKLAAALPSGNYVDLDDDPTWTLDRALILQAAGVLDGDFQPTERFVEIVLQAEAARGPEEFNELRTKMKTNCNKCHSQGFVESHMKASDEILKAADHEFAKAIAAVQGLYRDGILQKPEGWKFAPDLLQYYDAKTKIEQELYLIMLEYRQRTFQGAFHASNDYMHWYGWAPLKTAVNTILEEEKRMRAEHAALKVSSNAAAAKKH
ncbi:MAG TPA: multiheme c-type cytochrome [Gammaproteobacteria bacterium]|nr:multiheme c-type cytochrome [Gammaproteobacteria bacterium]